MKLATLGKFWLALLLLVSSLGSAPVGSMQQGAPDAISSLVYGPSLPIGRAGAHEQLRGALAEPTAPGSGHSDLPIFPFFADADRFDEAVSAHHSRASWPPQSGGCRPLCESLPYHANAPPA